MERTSKSESTGIHLNPATLEFRFVGNFPYECQQRIVLGDIPAEKMHMRHNVHFQMLVDQKTGTHFCVFGDISFQQEVDSSIWIFQSKMTASSVISGPLNDSCYQQPGCD